MVFVWVYLAGSLLMLMLNIAGFMRLWNGGHFTIEDRIGDPEKFADARRSVLYQVFVNLVGQAAVWPLAVMGVPGQLRLLGGELPRANIPVQDDSPEPPEEEPPHLPPPHMLLAAEQNEGRFAQQFQPAMSEILAGLRAMPNTEREFDLNVISVVHMEIAWALMRQYTREQHADDESFANAQDEFVWWAEELSEHEPRMIVPPAKAKNE